MLLTLLTLTSTSISAPNPFHMRTVEKELSETLRMENYREEPVYWPAWSPSPVGFRISLDYGFKTSHPILMGSGFGFRFADQYQFWGTGFQDARGEFFELPTTEMKSERIYSIVYPDFIHSHLTQYPKLGESPERFCLADQKAWAKPGADAMKNPHINGWHYRLEKSSFLGSLLSLVYDPGRLVFTPTFAKALKDKNLISSDLGFLEGVQESFFGEAAQKEKKGGYEVCPAPEGRTERCFCLIKTKGATSPK